MFLSYLSCLYHKVEEVCRRDGTELEKTLFLEIALGRWSGLKRGWGSMG